MKPSWLEPCSLKWNPFAQDVPVEALLATPAIDHFCRRIERTHIRKADSRWSPASRARARA